MIAGKRVLVIEDEFFVSAMLIDVLEDAGAVALGPAATFSEAMRLVDEGGFDMAVLDWNLDGTRSDPIAQALAERRVPYVISTGYGGADGEIAAHITAAAAAGLVEVPVLAKPYDPAQLIALLAALPRAD